MITTRSLLCYASITSKANLYVFGFRRFTKNHQYKGEDRLTQTLQFFPSSQVYIYQKYKVPPKPRPKPPKNIMMKSAVTAFSLCQRQRL